MSMKALVLAPQPFFSPRGTPFSVYYRTLVTSESGVKVDLLTYGEGQDVDIPGVRIIRIPRLRFLGPVKIGPSYQKIVLDVFMFIWTVALLMRNRYDFVHAHEEAVFYSLFLKPIFGFKLIYDMHSSLPQQLTNFKFTEMAFFIGLFKLLENACLRSADAVITICPDLRDYVDRLLGPNKKHLLIENSIFEPVKLKSNGSNKQDFGNDSSPALPEGRDLIVYAGTLEPYQGIDIVLNAFKQVLSRFPNAFLVIAGGNPLQVSHYKKMAAGIGIEKHTLFTGRVPQKTAKEYNRKATLLLSPRSSGTNTPLKIYEQLASGIPLLATRIYSHTQVLDESVAFLSDPDSDAMADVMISVLESNLRRQAVAAKAKDLYQRAYSRPVYEKKMKTLLEAFFQCAA
jgi:glycosyltransferase involved in cell wall biosynthesis